MFLEDIVATAHGSIHRYPAALDYLKSREVTEQDIERFRLGYGRIISVPEDGHPDRGRFLTETYRGRKLEEKIIFPFTDGTGAIVGLAGRSITTKDFKVFATDFAKFTGFFFGLYEALPFIYKMNRVYVVEGFFDLLAISKVSPNSVATITSGMNMPQYEQLCMYCDKVVTCFDEDEAGQIGRDRADKLGNNISHLRLDAYKDPAQCLETLKLKKFSKYMLDHSPFC